MTWTAEDVQRVQAEIDSTFDLFCHCKLGNPEIWIDMLKEFPVEVVIEAFERYRRGFLDYVMATGYEEQDEMTEVHLSDVLVRVYELMRH